MEEEVISFETAKLANDKRFPKELKDLSKFYVKPNCKMFGIDEHDRTYPIKNSSKNKLYTIGQHVTLNLSNVFYAPTQSLLQKWLREKYKIHITICFCEYSVKSENGWSYSFTNPTKQMIWKGKYKTYEEALEKGLYQALLLIKS